MTPIKRPSLERQTRLLEMIPQVGIEEGVARVCERFARVSA